MGIFDRLKKVFNNKSSEIYDKGLKKTRDNFSSAIKSLSKKYSFIDDDYFEELEDILIMADIGVNTVLKLMDKLKVRIKEEKITSPTHLEEVIIDELFITYVNNSIISNNLNFSNNEYPTVFLFVGVNGVGKTTTIAKMASKYLKEGKKVLLIAADTFRAGAREQLINWGKKLNCDVFSSDVTDPAAVVFEGLTKAIDNHYDLVLVDTAGRLQNKINLMKELEKINSVISKNIFSPAHETLLVLDATTGQNGISQAKEFMEATNITGIVLTKLDGTAKGGIVIAIKEEVNIPVKYIGLGEKESDLVSFDIEEYIYGLFKDFRKEGKE